MKSNRFNRIIITALTTLTTFLFCFSAVSVMAQNGRSTDAERQRMEKIMSPNANIEEFRTELKSYMTDLDNALSNFQAIPAVREQFEKTGFNPADVGRVKASIDQLSVEDLMKMREAYAKFPNWRESASFVYQVSQKASKGFNTPRKSGNKSGGNTSNVITPDTCPDISGTPSYTDIAITKAFLILADALMEGFPTDLLSIALRLPAIAAKAALEAAILAEETLRGIYEFCISPTTEDVQNIVDAAKQEILDNAAANTTNIVNNDNSNKDTIVLNDNTNKDTIVLNDNTNKDTIVANDDAHFVSLTNLINATRTAIINNANDNKDEVKNLLLRTQIEADLASTDGSVFVALYETPSNVCLPALNDKGFPQLAISLGAPAPTQCGLLDLVRSIVRDTMVNVNTSSTAASFFAVGDQQLALGNYKAAYTNYRKAYKAASK